MNLSQSKLTKDEWCALEVPVEPKEKMIINLMEEVINILSTCKDLSDPEFSMYETMKHAVDKEVYYPLYDK